MSYCLVRNCRFPDKHLTKGHQCSKCKKFGHGLLECENVLYRDQLLYELNLYIIKFPIDLYCKVKNCLYKHNHTTESHICNLCNKRTHDLNHECNNINSVYKINCPSCRKENIIPVSQLPTFGSETNCVICYDKANVYLPQCGHVNICLSCVKTLDKK